MSKQNKFCKMDLQEASLMRVVWEVDVLRTLEYCYTVAVKCNRRMPSLNRMPYKSTRKQLDWLAMYFVSKLMTLPEINQWHIGHIKNRRILEVRSN